MLQEKFSTVIDADAKKKSVLNVFIKFTEKHLRLSLFFAKVACCSPATLLKS